MSASTIAPGAHDPGRRGILYLYRELWRQSAGNHLSLVAAMTLLILAQCVLLAIPYFAGRAINTLQSNGAAGLADAALWLSCVVGVTAVSWLFHGPGRILERNVSLTVRQRISGELVSRLMHLPLSWHEANHSGATAHRVQQSGQALAAFAQSQFIYLSSVVRLVGPMVALWLLQPVIGGTAIAGFVLIGGVVVGFDRAMIRLAHHENAAERSFSSALIDSFGNATTLFALRQARAVAALLQRRLESVFAPLRRSIVLNEAKWCTVDISTKILSCGLVALFAWRSTGTAAGATVMLGSLYMVWEYASQAGGVISAFASHFQTFARQTADYASADPIRAAKLAPNAGVEQNVAEWPAADSWQRCEIRDLTFRHPAARTAWPTLDRVSLTLERGKRYALIGASGSGKSSLLRVLAGLYEPDGIVIDRYRGPSIVTTAQAAHFLRTSATLIPQDAEVFEGTLSENLAVCESLSGVPQAQDYAGALSLARASEFIDTTCGLEAPIAQRAANWSGGQRARVALARGILAAQGSALLLLDEPTANLDPRTEVAVYENLFGAFKTACIVSSIHRLHLLDRFDSVIVMHDGRVVAQGAPATLAQTSAEYQQLLAAHGESPRSGTPAAA